MGQEFSIALIGLFGVLVGGIISFGTQWHFQRRSEEQATIGLMRKLQFLLLDTINDVLVWERHLSEEIPAGHQGLLWPLVQPMSNFHSEKLFADAACLALLCDGKSDDFLHKLTNLISFRNSIFTLLNRYNRDREELNVLTAPFARVVPGQLHAEFAINAAERPDLIMKINAIESLVQSIRSMLETTKPLANEVGGLFPTVAKRIAGDKFKVRFDEVAEPQAGLNPAA